MTREGLILFVIASLCLFFIFGYDLPQVKTNASKLVDNEKDDRVYMEQPIVRGNHSGSIQYIDAVNYDFKLGIPDWVIHDTEEGTWWSYGALIDFFGVDIDTVAYWHLFSGEYTLLDGTKYNIPKGEGRRGVSLSDGVIRIRP